MSSAYDDVLSSLDAGLGRQRLDAMLPTVRKAFAGLRRVYRETGRPGYRDCHERLAYAIGYHPVHQAIARWAFDQARSTLDELAGRRSIRVVFLGAGSGAELVAFADLVADSLPDVGTLEAVLVDRQGDWKVAREMVALAPVRRKLGARALEVEEIELDLLAERDRPALAAALQEADVIVCQALLSEVACEPRGPEAIDRLFESLPDGVPFLLVELDRSDGGKAVLDRLPGGALRTLCHAQENLAIGRPPRRLRERFFADRDDLWARQRARVAMRLIVRGELRTRSAVSSIELTPCQRRVVEQFNDFLSAGSERPVAVLCGAAGTGKSTLVGELVRLALRAGRVPNLMAPTGQASGRLRDLADHPASTIHSALYCRDRMKLDEQGGYEVTFKLGGAVEGDLWIVDEASLVGDRSIVSDDAAVRLRFNEGKLLGDLLDRLAAARRGTQILFVGDRYQLPPIGDGSRLPALDEDSLSARLQREITVWELATIMRQAEGSAVLEAAERCRAGTALVDLADVEEIPSNELSRLSDAFENGSATVICHANAAVARVNREIRSWWGRSGAVPAPGDRLVAIRTTPDRDFVNGDEMIVEEIGERFEITRRLGRGGRHATAHLLELVVSVDGFSPFGRVSLDVLVLLDGVEGHSSGELDEVERVLTIDAESRYRQAVSVAPGLTRDRFLREDPVFNALRVVYPYARTCHRAQGSEWDTVVVDLSHENRAPEGWDYTAVTRARRRLLVVNRAARPKRFDIGTELRTVFAEAGCEVELHPLQHGAWQAIVADGSMRAKVDVYVKRGVPSNIVINRGDDVLVRCVRPLLERWAARVRAQCQLVRNPTVIERTDAALAMIDGAGMQITRRRTGDWDAEIEAIDEAGASAALRFGYNAAGTLREIRATGDGEARTCIDAVSALLFEPVARTGSD